MKTEHLHQHGGRAVRNKRILALLHKHKNNGVFNLLNTLLSYMRVSANKGTLFFSLSHFFFFFFLRDTNASAQKMEANHHFALYSA